MAIYDIGDQPTITGAFTNVDGDATAPTAVTVIVREPDGTETTYTSPDSSIVLGTSTTFTFPSTLDASGAWVVRMKGTATVVAAGEFVIAVRESRVDSP